MNFLDYIYLFPVLDNDVFDTVPLSAFLSIDEPAIPVWGTDEHGNCVETILTVEIFLHFCMTSQLIALQFADRLLIVLLLVSQWVFYKDDVHLLVELLTKGNIE